MSGKTLMLCILGLSLVAADLYTRPQEIPRAPGDTLTAVAAEQDTVARRERKNDIDTLIIYFARDSVVYSMKDKNMKLFGQGGIDYKEISLRAEQITVRWDSASLVARGVPDPKDTTGQKFIGLPILKDGGEKYDGTLIRYNFKTQKGKITYGLTEMEKGFYRGGQIKKVEKDMLFIEHGLFTTCEIAEPHFHFGSPKLKVIMRDHIVAEPVFLYVSDVPVFALPFAVFPNKSGRRSGIIPPAYGQDNRRGRYLSRFGYFWAMSDYTDLTTTFDWYARGGWLNRSLFRYNKRYAFDGALSASVSNEFSGAENDPDRAESEDYNVRLYHNQQFNPTTSLYVDFTWSSGTYYQKYSNDLNDILRQNIISNATLSKIFEDLNSSLSLTIYRNQNLQSGDISEQIPSLRYSQNQFFPFRKKRRGGGSSDLPWYEMLGLSYNGSALNNRSLTHTVIRSTVTGAESLKVGNRLDRYGLNHDIGTSYSPKFGYFTVAPFFSYNEKWYWQYIVRDTSGVQDRYGFNAVRTFNTGVGVSTRFFGIWQPQMLGVTGVRHTVTPTMNLMFQPDFSDPSYGYYGTYTDARGNTVRYSKFEREVYGGPGRGKVANLGIGIGNNFEAKYLPSDSAAREEKIQLMNVSMSTGYNFAADSMRLAPLSVSFRTSVGSFLNIDGSTSYNFYKFEAGRRVNKLLINEGKIADLTSFSLSLSTSLSGQRRGASAGSTSGNETMNRTEGTLGNTAPMRQEQIYQGLYYQPEPNFDIPWNLSMSYNFSQFQDNPSFKSISSTVSFSLSLSLTQNWQIMGSGGYDLRRKEVTAPSISVNRDLHCWLMTFQWYPLGFYSGYRLEIRVKAPQLQDLKITKQGSQRPTYF